MRKVRVLKKTPHLKVGWIGEPCGILYLFNGTEYDAPHSVQAMVEQGYLEYVKEPKCKICNDTGYYHYSSQIGKEKPTGGYNPCSCQEPKSLEKEFNESDGENKLSNFRKAQIATEHFKLKLRTALFGENNS